MVEVNISNHYGVKGVVAYANNPSYSEGGRRITSLRPAWDLKIFKKEVGSRTQVVEYLPSML
jgi:hypothetical protein